MSDIQDFENWVQDLETKEQPEAPSSRRTAIVAEADEHT